MSVDDAAALAARPLQLKLGPNSPAERCMSEQRINCNVLAALHVVIIESLERAREIRVSIRGDGVNKLVVLCRAAFDTGDKHLSTYGETIA